MSSAEIRLTEAELSDLGPYLEKLDQAELLSVAHQLAHCHRAHPHRAPDKRTKCIGRTPRIADCEDILRRNVARILQLSRLNGQQSFSQWRRTRAQSNFSFSLETFPAGAPLRGGLGHDGPLIPEEIAQWALGDPRALEIAEQWDKDDEARDLKAAREYS